MKHVLILIGIVFLLVGSASAIECGSYFTKSTDKRDKAVSAALSFELSMNRLYSRADDLYDILDDMDNDENLSSASDDFSDLVDRKNDALDDLDDFNSKINSYDSAISDSRNDLPIGCFDTFNVYDDDLDEMQSYYRDIKRQWDRFIDKYNVVNDYRSDLSSHTVSEAKSTVDSMRDYADSVVSAVDNGVDWDITGSEIFNDTIYTEEECFDMISLNIEKTNKECTTKCNQLISTLNCDNDSCDYSNYTTQINNLSSKLGSCNMRLNELKTSSNDNCPICEACSDKDTTIISLNNQINSLKSEKNRLSATVVNITVSRDLLKKSLEDSQAATCDSSWWMYGFIGLLILIILAWIFAL